MPRSLLWPDPRVKPPFGSVELDRGHPLARGLVGYWLFNEGGGPLALDLAGANIGTLTNGPTWVSGRAGPALNFDGVNDYVDAGAAANFTSEGFTLALWINFDTLDGTGEDGNPVLFNKGQFEVDGYYLQSQDAVNRNLVLVTNQSAANQQTKSSNNTLSLGDWQHLVATRSGATVKLYRNGVEVSYASTGTHIDPASTTSNSVIGRYLPSAANFHVNGLIDDVRVYNRALSAVEVLQFFLEPYAMLRPIVRRRYFVAPVAAGAGAHGAMYPRMQRHVHQSWTVPRIG